MTAAATQPLRRTSTAACLTATWVLLNGELSVANVVAGLLVAGGVLAVVPLAAPVRTHRIHPIGVLRFTGFVLWSLVVSTAVVFRTTVRPTPARLAAGIVRVELPPTTPLAVTLVANAITVTPGTLTVAATEEGVLHVHVLGLGDVQEFRAGVLDLHRRVLAAFAPRGGPAS